MHSHYLQSGVLILVCVKFCWCFRCERRYQHTTLNAHTQEIVQRLVSMRSTCEADWQLIFLAERVQSKIRVDLLDIDVGLDAISAHMRCAHHDTLVHPIMISSQRNVE